MSDNEEIEQLVQTLKQLKPGRILKRYITHATFPKFKSIEPGTRVDFSFPLTALVGANGIGKSSLLHALWGMPYGYSTSKFWFATALDPIAGNQKDPQRYFYGYWHDEFNGVVETRKARLGRKRGSDYWEPYRWSKADGMMPMPEGEFEGKAKDRWNPVRRAVVYINLKTVFGSFDRYFYFDERIRTSDKREVMLREAKRLKVIKEKNKTSYRLGGYERLFENRDLTAEELMEVSRILGRNYDSARLIRHSLYPGNRGEDLSVIFKRGAEYSEAFAGSGEIAAVSAVVQILAAEQYSLVLLDEPETSLHPGAQRALLRFLLEQIKKKKCQVIISTHSSEFLMGLPHDAIKVFEDNGSMQTRVLPFSSPYAALKRLGKPPEHKRRILVEDRLAELIVLQAAKGLDQGDADALEIKVAPGGAEAILKYLGPAAMVSGDEVFVLLDGDKKLVDQFSDPAQIAPNAHSKLEKLVKDELGCEPKYLISGGNDTAGHQASKEQANLNYLAWLRKRVAYLPKRLPEQIVLDAFMPEGNYTNASSEACKTAFKRLLTQETEVDLSANDIIVVAKIKVAQLPRENKDLKAIRKQITQWLHT